MSLLMGRVAELTALIKSGNTIAAMEQFYADDVTMQENEMPLRRGKNLCLEHERRMLAGVTAMTTQLLNQAISEETSVVFSE